MEDLPEGSWRLRGDEVERYPKRTPWKSHPDQEGMMTRWARFDSKHPTTYVVLPWGGAFCILSQAVAIIYRPTHKTLLDICCLSPSSM